MVPVAGQRSAVSEMFKLIAAGDDLGLDAMHDRSEAGQLVSGTPVLVLEVHGNPGAGDAPLPYLELRVTDGPAKGAKVFTWTEYVARLVPAGGR